MRKAGQILIPQDEISKGWIEGKKDGLYKAKITKDRDLPKHKRWFVLVGFAYQHWDVDETDGIAKMCFEEFRKEIIKLCGYYRQVWRLDGSFTVEAKSIAFSNMDDNEFNALYSKTIDIVLQNVLKGYTKDDLEDVVMHILRFS